MKTVLITGGAGFIGSHLCDRYLQMGWKVIALDDLSTGRAENLQDADLSPNFEFVRGDVRATPALRALFGRAIWSCILRRALV